MCLPVVQVMSLVNELGGAEEPDVFHDTDSQDGQALFHRAGLMLRLGKQVGPDLFSQGFEATTFELACLGSS